MDPHLLDVVGVHGGDPGGGVHGDVLAGKAEPLLQERVDLARY